VIKCGLSSSLRNPTLLQAIEGAVLGVAQIKTEASLLANLHLASLAEQSRASGVDFPALFRSTALVLGDAGFCRNLFKLVSSVDRKDGTSFYSSLMATYRNIYTPLRAADTPKPASRSGRVQCVDLAADAYTVALSNHVLVHLESRVKKVYRHLLATHAACAGHPLTNDECWKVVDWLRDAVFDPSLPLTDSSLRSKLSFSAKLSPDFLVFLLAEAEKHQRLLHGTRIPVAPRYVPPSAGTVKKAAVKKEKTPHWSACFFLHAELARFIEQEHQQLRYGKLRRFSLAPLCEPTPGYITLDSVTLQQLGASVESDPRALPDKADAAWFKSWLWARYFCLESRFPCSVESGPVYEPADYRTYNQRRSRVATGAMVPNAETGELEAEYAWSVAPIVARGFTASLNTTHKRRFEFSVATDGVGLSIFCSSEIAGVPSDKKWALKQKEKNDKNRKQKDKSTAFLESLWDKAREEGVTMEQKLEEYRIIAIDPGRKSLVTWVEKDRWKTPEEGDRFAKLDGGHVSNGQWQHESGTRRRTADALARIAAHPPIAALKNSNAPSGKTASLQTFSEYARWTLNHLATLLEWNCRTVHRRQKFGGFSERQRAVAAICSRILAPPPSNDGGVGSGSEEEEQKPVIVLFGDALFSATSKGSAPGSYKRIYEGLQQRARTTATNGQIIVLKYDEFRTSRVCPRCGHEFAGPLGLCPADAPNHPRSPPLSRAKQLAALQTAVGKKRKRGESETQKEKEKKEEKNGEQRSRIHGVRVCTHTQCLATWNRDVAAARNLLDKFLYAATHAGAIPSAFAPKHTPLSSSSQPIQSTAVPPVELC
jgi:hypothetical protein